MRTCCSIEEGAPWIFFAGREAGDGRMKERKQTGLDGYHTPMEKERERERLGFKEIFLEKVNNINKSI